MQILNMKIKDHNYHTQLFAHAQYAILCTCTCTCTIQYQNVLYNVYLEHLKHLDDITDKLDIISYGITVGLVL